MTGFTKPGSPAAVAAILVYRFAGELIHEITPRVTPGQVTFTDAD